MKKLLKTASVTFLSGALLLTGCSNNAKESFSSKDYELSDVTFPLEEEVTLKIMTSSSPLAPADPNEKLIYQRLEEKTGVHIDWRNYTTDVFGEKRNLAIASGELPDAIFNSAFSDYDLLKHAKDGVIVPVEDMIQFMPNLQMVLDKAPQYKSMMTAPDGHIYAFPWIEELGEGKESMFRWTGCSLCRSLKECWVLIRLNWDTMIIPGNPSNRS